MKKKVVSILMTCVLTVGILAGCGDSKSGQEQPVTGSAETTMETDTVTEKETQGDEEETNLTKTQQIIKEAEGMTMEELAKKAIEE